MSWLAARYRGAPARLVEVPPTGRAPVVLVGDLIQHLGPPADASAVARGFARAVRATIASLPPNVRFVR